MMLLGLQAAFAQRNISGRVTSSEDGSSIPGATVLVKGTTIGAITDVDGKYTLAVPAGNDVLLVSFVGMKTQEITLGESNVVDAVLNPDVTMLPDVVVTALGIQREKKALGYSVQDVSGAEISQARETNVINALSGRVAGVQVTNSSGAVGSSSRIVLRGVNSLTGNNQPLFVVDGVPINNSDFNSGSTVDGYGGVNRGNGAMDLNPNDIQTISVLKGPNAAALYGSRASNGVILITTKSGITKGTKTKAIGVELSNTTTFEKPLRLPKFQNSYGQGSGGQFSFVDGAGGGTNDGVDESWGPKLDNGLMITQFDSPMDENGNRIATPWISHPDNIKNFFETGVTTATSLALSGGNEKANGRVAYTQLNQWGIVPNTDYTTKTLNVNLGVNLTDKLHVNAVGTYLNAKSDNMPGIGYSGENVMQQFMWHGRQVDFEGLKTYTYPISTQPSQNAWYPAGYKYNWNYNYHNNPYFTLYENLSGVERNRLFGNAKILYEFYKDLSAHIRTGIDYYNNFNTNRIAASDIENAFGSYSENQFNFKEMNTDFLIMYNHKFKGPKIDLAVNFGGNRMDQYTQNLFASADELAVPDVFNVANSRVPVRATQRNTQKRINSIYFSGQVAWKSALFLDFTGRNDWSSTLPKDSWSYFYPSISLSGVITDFYENKSKFFSYGKLRISWARVGSDTDPYSLYPTVSFGDGWSASTKLLNLFIPNELPNALLKPQFTTSLELGGDFRFFQNRLSLDLTYYNSSTTDQILTAPISGASGYNTMKINAGEISNKGIEMQLGATIFKAENKKQFGWDINLNYARNRNEVISLAPGVENYVIGTYWDLKVIAQPGHPYGDLYGYDYLRDPDGNIINRDGVPVQGDLKVLGNYQPKWVGGISTSLSYYNFDFSCLFDFHMGGELYSMTTTWGRYSGVLDETLKGREGGIVGEGVKEVYDENGNVTGYVPNDVVVTAESYNHSAFVNSIAGGSVFDASYIKLRELRLAYTFTFTKTVKELTIAFIGRNLALLYSKVPHIDPETSFTSSNLQGLEFGQLPSTRSLGFNISIKL
jgi:TonB-linked SusC/RagA family outer membrane protein